MKYFFIILILFSNIIIAQNSGSNKRIIATKKKSNEFSLNTPSCGELIYYRDNTLAKDFNSAFDKHQINQEAIDQIKKIKDDLLNQRGWDELMSLGYSTTTSGVTIAQIAQIIKMGCDLIKDGVGLMPTGESTLINKGVSTSEKVYKQIKLGKDIKKIVKSEADRVVYDAVLDEFNLVGKSVKMALNFSDNLKKLIKIPEERLQLKNQVDSVLNMLETNFTIYQQKINESSIDIKEINDVVFGIDKYLSENCNNMTVKKTNINSTVKNKYVNPVVVTNTKKTIGNSFYVFLHVSLNINGKSTDVISSPIFYEGKLTDSMSKQKEDFQKQIELEFLNKPKYYRDALKYLNDNSIKVHYGKPYSTILLKSENAVYEAIEAYKSMMRETVEGLGEIDFLELK